MRAHPLLSMLAGLLLSMPLALDAKPGTDDFEVPLQMERSVPVRSGRAANRVRSLQDATVGQTVLQARRAQDVIAAAVSKRTAGCQVIRYGSGDLGWVATGTATYPATDNPVAARRTVQESRLKAMTDARERLGRCLRALPPGARQQLTASLEQNDAIRLALINLADNEQQRHEQALRILERGFVAYAVEHDPASRTLFVHLVTTPATAMRLTRPTAGTMETTAIKEGTRQLLAEIGAGLIPPVGHRLIVVNASGELTLVGYAVNLVGVHPDPNAQRKLRDDSLKIATARAGEALIGLATGDDQTWQDALDSASRDDIRHAASGYDAEEPSTRRFAQIRELLLDSLKDDPGLQELREGRLPKASLLKSMGDDSTVLVAILYTPPVRPRETVPPPAATPATPTVPPAPAVPPASTTTEPAATVKPVTSPAPAVPPASTTTEPAATVKPVTSP
ncbi:MAG: hypothetical protein EKK69_02855 [Candidatus Competibacteraceae bacterium]|nr:MAG: hypothetical protein EKK69_02855 [Candidatus Competibacteraceae bacterium]